MSKKIAVGFAVILFSIFALANSAFAAFDAIYTVGFNGSTTLEDSFDWNEQPWLYLDLPYSGLTYTISWWNPDGTDTYYDNFILLSGSSDKVWHTLDDWLDKRQLGYWNVRADYSSHYGAGSGETGFTVTPEPVSSALFLIGGVSLAAFRYRKRVFKGFKKVLDKGYVVGIRY